MTSTRLYLTILGAAILSAGSMPVCHAQLAGTGLPQITDSIHKVMGTSSEPLSEEEIRAVKDIFAQLVIGQPVEPQGIRLQFYEAIAAGTARKKLRALGPRIIPELINTLNNPRELVAGTAAVTLADFKRPEPIIDAIVQGKVSPENKFVPGIFIWMGEESVPALTPLLKSSDPNIRYLALLIPAGISARSKSKNQALSSETTELILTSLNDPSPRLRSAAVIALTAANPVPKNFLPLLEEKLSNDPDSDVRKRTAFALQHIARIQPPQARRSILRALSSVASSDANHEVRLASALAIQQIHNRDKKDNSTKHSHAANVVVLAKEFGIVDKDGKVVVPTKVIPLKSGSKYGFNMVVDTGSKPVTIKVQLALPSPAKSWGLPPVALDDKSSHHVSDDKRVGTYIREEVPAGVTNRSWSVAEGDPAGEYVLTVWIDNKVVAKYTFELSPTTPLPPEP